MQADAHSILLSVIPPLPGLPWLPGSVMAWRSIKPQCRNLIPE